MEPSFFRDSVEAVRRNTINELMQPVQKWVERMVGVSEPPAQCPWDDFKPSKDLA